MTSDDEEAPSTKELDASLPVQPGTRPGCITVVLSPDRDVLGKSIWIGKDRELKLGRHPDDGLRLSDPRVSRVQFRIVWDTRQGRHRVVDDGSRNGTFLNGKQTDSSVLNRGDVLRAGDSLFVFDHGDIMSERRAEASRAAKTELPLLLQGATGTGKELLARFIHRESERSGAFVPINCAALPRELLAAELFGHTRGAFSGAAAPRAGLFAAAEGGTLFLDEIGDMPLELQPALLRAVEHRKIRPVGADLEAPVDVRIIAATNVELESAARLGKFRDDLHARLAQIVIRLPGLAERRRELLAIARELSGEENQELSIDTDAAEALLLWTWPRNVRELEALLRSLFVVRASRHLTLVELTEIRSDIASQLRTQRGNSEPPLAEQGNPLADRERLGDHLRRASGNVSQVARELGTTRAQVYRWMKRLGLKE